MQKQIVQSITLEMRDYIQINVILYDCKQKMFTSKLLHFFS